MAKEKETAISDENVDLLTEMCADPQLQQIFCKLEDKSYSIPDYYEEELADAIKLNLPTIVSISSPEDYQTVLQLLTRAQMCRERVVEIVRHVVALKHRWLGVHKNASRRLHKAYYAPLRRLPEHMKKTVLATALYPVEAGLDDIESLVLQSEVVLRHFDQTLWNLKEMSRIVTEYFSLLKYGNAGQGV